MPDITNPAALLLNFTASAAIGADLEGLAERKPDTLQGVIVEIGGARLSIYVDDDLNLHTALETREGQENSALVKQPWYLSDDFTWICSRNDVALLCHQPEPPKSTEEVLEAIPVLAGAGHG